MNNLQNNQKSDTTPMGYDALLAPVPLWKCAKGYNLILLGLHNCDNDLVLNNALRWANDWLNYSIEVERDSNKSKFPLPKNIQEEAKLIGKYFENLLALKNWC